jgi:aspartate/methionine/tyrosine aminotransferase
VPYAPYEFMLRIDAVNYDPHEERRVSARLGRAPINISSGVNFLPPPPPLLAAFRRGLRAPTFRSQYDGPHGHIISRTAVSTYECAVSERGLVIDDHNVVVTTGVSMAMHVLGVHLAARIPGAEVLVPAPTFPLAGAALAAAGLRVREVLHDGDGRLLPTPEELMRAASRGTRLLFLNLFNNPTGECYPEAELATLLAWAREDDLLVLVDKVSVDLVEPGTAPNVLDVACAAGALDHVVVVSSLSKERALPGLRIGWMIAPRPLAEELGRINGLACMSSVGACASLLFVDMLCRTAARLGAGGAGPAASQAAVAERFVARAARWAPLAPGLGDFLEAYRDPDRLARTVRGFASWHRTLLATLDRNLAALTRTFDQEIVLGGARSGGFNVFVRVPRLDAVDPYAFAVRLFRRHGVQILPGPSFADADALRRRRPGFWTRISFAMELEALIDGMAKMLRFAGEYGA